MSFFSKFFGQSKSAESEEQESKFQQIHPVEKNLSIDEQFIFNFKKNGGKFIYCENLSELKEQFENILEENDWFESSVMCYEPMLYALLDENKLSYLHAQNPKFIFTSCEGLIAEEGSVLFSSNQIKQHKPNELPTNIIIYATASQLLESKGDGLSYIRKKYTSGYPSNITTIKYFEKDTNENFTHYGSAPKNTYLLLLEDF